MQAQIPDTRGRFNLRSFVKLLSLGVGTLIFLSLTGCYGGLKREELSTASRMSPLSSPKKIDRTLVEEVQKKWRLVFQAFRLKDSPQIAQERIQQAYSSTISLLDHLDTIGFNAEVDAMLGKLEPQDRYINALIKGLREMEVPGEELAKIRAAWVNEDKQAAMQNIRQHGGVSRCLRQALSKLEMSVVSRSSRDATFQAPLGGKFTSAAILSSACTRVSVNCAALFAAAAVLCAINDDSCMAGALWALALCYIHSYLEGCPIW